jgi:hypothetical protein
MRSYYLIQQIPHPGGKPPTLSFRKERVLSF